MTETKMPALELEPRERATRSTKPCEPHSTAPQHRNSPRNVRRAALLAAMGAPPPWRRLADVVTGGAA